jgi:hypothetical protein
MERENLHGRAKGKAQVATIARPKVPTHRIGADCSVVVLKRGNAPWGEEGRSSPLDRDNRQREERDTQWKAAVFVPWHEPDESRGSRPDL